MQPSLDSSTRSGPRPVTPPAPVSSPALTRARIRLDVSVLAGAFLAVLGILLALILEGGGNAWQILQPAAAVIVLGGTCAAVLVQFPFTVVRGAVRCAVGLLGHRRLPGPSCDEQLLHYAARARRHGLVSLDPDLDAIADPFTRRCLTLAVDGVSASSLEQVMQLDCARREEQEDQLAQVWEAAGGFAPTMGILGAVLGLIHVMQQLDNMRQVGQGIAVAFVATLYGVGTANFLFLPMAGRLRSRQRVRQQERAAVLDSVCLIIQGASPRMLRERLSTQAAPDRAAG